MSSTSPPEPNVNTFNNDYWINGEEFITQDQADKRYLRFPVAQGLENLAAINVNGNAVFNSTLQVKDNTTHSILLDQSVPQITITDGTTTNTINKNGYTTRNSVQNATHFLNFSDSSATGTGAIQKTAGLSCNPSTNTIEATNLTITNIDGNPDVTFSTNATFNGGVIVNNSVDILTNYGSSALRSLTISDNTTNQGLDIRPNANATNNPSVVSGEIVVETLGTQNTETLTLTTTSTNYSAVKVSPSSVSMGFGGSTSTPNTSVVCNGTNVVVTPNGDMIVNGRTLQIDNAGVNWNNTTNGYYALAKRTTPLPTASVAGLSAVNTWTKRATNNCVYEGICWSAELGIFVAVASSRDGVNNVMTSSDGIEWAFASASDDDWSSVCWSPELRLFVAVGRTTTGNVMYSSNGTSWTTIAPNAGVYNGVCWSPELRLFVAVGTSVAMYSSNGTSWNSVFAPANAWNSVCWSPELSLFVAVASTATDRIMTSSNGINWSALSGVGNSNTWTSVCWSAELGLFCAVSSGGGLTTRAITSPNGINWTLQTTPSNKTWQGVCWACSLGIFVAVASNASQEQIMYSIDGVNWILLTGIIFTDGFQEIAWADELGIFAAVSISGAADRVTTSSIRGRPVNSFTAFNNNYFYYGQDGNYTIGNRAKSLNSLAGRDFNIIATGGSMRFVRVATASPNFEYVNANGGTIQYIANVSGPTSSAEQFRFWFRVLGPPQVDTTILTMNRTAATFGTDINVVQSGTGILSQSGSGTNTLKNTNVNGGWLGTGAPVTKTGNFTLGDTENMIICNGTATITITFPTASANTGRIVHIKTITAQLVNSSASNILPIGSNTAGTAILTNVAGRHCMLVCDGTNWVIMNAGSGS